MNMNEVMRELDELDAATWRRAMTDRYGKIRKALVMGRSEP